MLSAIPDPLLALYLGAIGMVIGSYLNVVAHRLPAGLSTVTPRSRCPACSQPIRARDNIPVLSYLLLRGRCRDCGSPIWWRYPAVESLTGVLFALCYLRFGRDASTLVAALFCALLVVLGLIDYDHYLLPNRITYPGIVAGLLLSTQALWTTPLSSVLAAVFGATVLLTLIGVWYLARGHLGMGFGDPKMLAMIGAFLGLSKTLLCLLLASLVGTVVSLLLLLRGRAHLQSKLPFGVYLAFAGVLSLFLGRWLVNWYLTLL